MTESIIQTWRRNSFDVEAVRITPQNAAKVAAWCGGAAARKLSENDDRVYVLVDVVHFQRYSQRKAFEGSWIVKKDDTFQIYLDEQFRHTFSQPKFAAVVAAIENAMGGNSWSVDEHGQSIEAVEVARQIFGILDGGTHEHV
jgi:hypothetical protein